MRYFSGLNFFPKYTNELLVEMKEIVIKANLVCESARDRYDISQRCIIKLMKIIECVEKRILSRLNERETHVIVLNVIYE